MLICSELRTIAAVWMGFLFCCIGLFAQQKATKDQPSRYALNPALITSADCIGDFIKMNSLEGVAKRKLAGDLLETKCMVLLKGIYVMPYSPATNVTRNGRVFAKTLPLLDVQKMREAGLNVTASLDLEESIRKALGLGVSPIEGYVPLDSLVSEKALGDAIAATSK
jgi:hypothetical protein